MASKIHKHYIVQVRRPSGSVLDKKVHARSTGVPGHLAYMEELSKWVVSPLYAHAKWHGAAWPPWHQGSKNVI